MSRLKIRMGHCLVAVFASVAMTASADTLAWYRFSEGAVGSRAGATPGAIADSSLRAKNASVRTLKSQTDYEPSPADESLLPTYARTSGFPILDPVSGETCVNETSLDFAAVGVQQSQTGAVLRVGSFMGTGKPSFESVTVEAMICTTGGTYNTFMPVVGLWGSETSCLGEYWSLMIGPKGKVVVRFAGTVTGDANCGYSQGTHTVTDGKWHHVALVHDGVNDVDEANNTLTFHVYVDGELDKEYVFSKSKSGYATYGDVPLYIGGYSKIGGRIFNGLIDEVRISDAALAPKEMLQIVKDYPIDADTMVYVPFDGGIPGPKTMFGNVNVVPGGPSVTLNRSSQGEDHGEIPYPEIADDVPTTVLSDGRFSTNRFLNPVAVRLHTTVNGNGAALNCASDAYMSGSFTSELFFKTDGQIEEARWDYASTLFRCGKSTIKLKLGTSLTIRYNKYDSATSTYKEQSAVAVGSAHEFDDSAWHHCAVVYDRDAQTLCVYVDRRLRYATEGIDLEPTNYFFFVGANPSGDSFGYFDGWIDGFRHTKRALSSNEFLCAPNDGEEPPDVLLRASFENGWKVTSGWQKLADAEPVSDEKGSVGFLSVEDGRLSGDLVWETNVVDGTATSRTNLFAAKLDGGYVGFPELPPFEGREITVEAFVKLSAYEASANLFRLPYGNKPGYAASPVLSLYPATATVGNSLNCRIAFTEGTFGPPNVESEGVFWDTLSFTKTGKNLLDNRWHHLAYVFSVETNESTQVESTYVTLYVDRQQMARHVYAGHLPFRSMHSPFPRFSIGLGASDQRVHGCFDELRITARALAPEEFMTTTNLPRGMMLIVR